MDTEKKKALEKQAQEKADRDFPGEHPTAKVVNDKGGGNVTRVKVGTPTKKAK